MCFGSRPKPPPLPEPRPTPPKPEKTAERVVVGTKRKIVTGSNRKSVAAGQLKNKKPTSIKRYGTQTLRIPLALKNLNI